MKLSKHLTATCRFAYTMLKAGITTFDPHLAGTKTLVLSPIFIPYFF